MGKETSTFREFSELAFEIKRKYGIGLQLVEIIGSRWSFVAGEEDEESFLPPERIRVGRRFGIVSTCWSRLPDFEKEKILTVVKRYDER